MRPVFFPVVDGEFWMVIFNSSACRLICYHIIDEMVSKNLTIQLAISMVKKKTINGLRSLMMFSGVEYTVAIVCKDDSYATIGIRK